VVGSIRIVVAIFSYDGGLYFGITGDYDSAPDIDVITAGIERGMADLLAIASPAKPARRRRATPAPRNAVKTPSSSDAARATRNGVKTAPRDDAGRARRTGAKASRNGGKPAARKSARPATAPD
jgi:diacylglycerol O-acyltransferase